MGASSVLRKFSGFFINGRNRSNKPPGIMDRFCLGLHLNYNINGQKYASFLTVLMAVVTYLQKLIRLCNIFKILVCMYRIIEVSSLR